MEAMDVAVEYRRRTVGVNHASSTIEGGGSIMQYHGGKSQGHSSVRQREVSLHVYQVNGQKFEMKCN